MKIVVNDANILIDLIKIDLIDSFFKLKLEMHTSDFVLRECLSDKKGVLIEYIKKGHLELNTFSDPTVLSYIQINNRDFSIADCSVLYLSKELKAILLTGEKKLRSAAVADKIEVKGIFWVFDELLKSGLITKHIFIKKLKLLKKANTWLPEIEFNKRLGACNKK